MARTCSACPRRRGGARARLHARCGAAAPAMPVVPAFGLKLLPESAGSPLPDAVRSGSTSMRDANLPCLRPSPKGRSGGYAAPSGCEYTTRPCRRADRFQGAERGRTESGRPRAKLRVAERSRAQARRSSSRRRIRVRIAKPSCSPTRPPHPSASGCAGACRGYRFSAAAFARLFPGATGRTAPQEAHRSAFSGLRCPQKGQVPSGRAARTSPVHFPHPMHVWHIVVLSLARVLPLADGGGPQARFACGKARTSIKASLATEGSP